MAGSLTAAVDLANLPPRNQLTLTGLGGSTATVYRMDAAGGRMWVRSANPASLSGGGWVGYDYEAPYGAAVTYMAVSDTGDTATSSAVTLSPQTPWLIHPGVPAFSVPIPGVLIADSEEFDVNQGVHVILDREDPIVVTDAARHTGTFDTIVRTDTAAELAAMTQILADGSPLLLQVAYDWTDTTEYRWVSVGKVTKARRSADFSDPGRNWTLPCTEVIAPAGLLQSQWTWNDVVANYATWNDVVAAYPTWNDVVLNNPTT